MAVHPITVPSVLVRVRCLFDDTVRFVEQSGRIPEITAAVERHCLRLLNEPPPPDVLASKEGITEVSPQQPFSLQGSLAELLGRTVFADNFGSVAEKPIMALGEEVTLWLETADLLDDSVKWFISRETKFSLAAVEKYRDTGRKGPVRHCVAEARKFVQFVDFYTRGKQDTISILDHDHVQSVFRNQAATYRGALLLNRLNEFFLSLTHSPMLEDIKKKMGVLLYGPAGTGKTTLAKDLCEKVGFVMLNKPFAGAEVQGGLVGLTEKKIRDVMQRAARFPWAPCALVIDEIDCLAPDRMGPGASTNAIEALSVVLTVLGGARPQENLFVFACTNRIAAMDKAFLRRMHGKFFAGLPSPKDRKSFLKDAILVEYGDDADMNPPVPGPPPVVASGGPASEDFDDAFVFDEKSILAALPHAPHDAAPQADGAREDRSILINDIIAMTLNFSGDAMTKLRTVMALKVVERQAEQRGAEAPGWTPRSMLMSVNDYRQSVLEVCRLESILFGDTYVPLIYECRKRDASEPPEKAPAERLWRGFDPFYEVSWVPTGRILVDLEQGRLLAERMVDKKPICSSYPSAVFGEPPRPGELTMNEVLTALIQFSVRRDVNFCQLVTGSTLARNSATTEDGAIRYVNSLVDEAAEYDHAMVIFDMDSIVCVQPTESSGESVSSTSFSVLRPLLMHYVFDVAANRAIFVPSHEPNPRSLFVVLISRDPTILRHFRSKTRFPKSHEEQERDIPQTCTRCRREFSEASNHLAACKYHKDGVYDPSRDAVLPYDVAMAAKPPQRQTFMWNCCCATFTAKDSGCETGAHTGHATR